MSIQMSVYCTVVSDRCVLAKRRTSMVQCPNMWHHVSLNGLNMVGAEVGGGWAFPEAIASFGLITRCDKRDC